MAVGVVLVFVGWALFFRYYPVEELVSDIGIQNTYFAAFMLALIGGFSSLTGTSLYAALIALANGGVNPIILGIIGGLGLFASDTVFYFLITKMRRLLAKITEKWERLFRNIWKLIYRLPPWVVFLGVLLYASFAPLPNDVLLVVLALSSYPYRQFAVFLFAGDIIMALMLTHFGSALPLSL
jgi:hypothetical protein